MSHKLFIVVVTFFTLFGVFSVMSGTVHAVESPACSTVEANNLPACDSVNVNELGFQIPTLGDLLTFAIRGFFAIAGITALFYMLLGAFGWITSGGDKDGITAARDKIQAAVVGLILIVAVLALVWTLEQVIFKRRICLGLSCPVTLPGLIETSGDANFCCVCINRTDNSLGERIDARTMKCLDTGEGK